MWQSKLEEIFIKLEVSFCYLKLHIAVLLCNVEPNLQILNFFVVPILTPAGSKSIGAYGGYETFVYKLIEAFRESNHIKFHIASRMFEFVGLFHGIMMVNHQ